MAQSRPMNEEPSAGGAEQEEQWAARQAAEQGSQRSRQQAAQQTAQRGKGQSGQGGQQYGEEQRQNTVNFVVAGLRGLGQLYDMQAATLRSLYRVQMRAASVFGLPDYSRMFQINDERALHLFSATTENLVHFVDQAGSALTETPPQIFRMFEQQMIDLNERWKYGLEELQHQAIESVQELKELSTQQADEMTRASESFSDATRASLRESGEQFRAAVRQGREFSSQQQSEVLRESQQAGREAEEGSQQKSQRHHAATTSGGRRAA